MQIPLSCFIWSPWLCQLAGCTHPARDRIEPSIGQLLPQGLAWGFRGIGIGSLESIVWTTRFSCICHRSLKTVQSCLHRWMLVILFTLSPATFRRFVQKLQSEWRQPEDTRDRQALDIGTKLREWPSAVSLSKVYLSAGVLHETPFSQGLLIRYLQKSFGLPFKKSLKFCSIFPATNLALTCTRVATIDILVWTSETQSAWTLDCSSTYGCQSGPAIQLIILWKVSWRITKAIVRKLQLQ